MPEPKPTNEVEPTLEPRTEPDPVVPLDDELLDRCTQCMRLRGGCDDGMQREAA